MVVYLPISIMKTQQRFQSNRLLYVNDSTYIHCAECPADFTHVPSVNGCYKLLTDKKAWVDAAQACRVMHLNTHLVVINNAEEQSAVDEFLASNNGQYFVTCILFIISKFTFSHGISL